MIKISKRFIPIITTILLLTNICPITTFANVKLTNQSLIEIEKDSKVNKVNDEDYGLADSIQNGCMLHAWNWYFNDVKNHLSEIAEAGFTTVQVSPVQPSNGSDRDTGHWWELYQPADFSVGNVLGSADEFKSMCEEADKYGIKIVVDIVSNHLAANGEKMANHASNRSWCIADYLKNNDAYWHVNDLTGTDDGNRYNMTNGPIGLPDLNTGNTELQGIIIKFLNNLQDLGADGFRFDAAKHIELPKDVDGEFGSDYWPNITNAIRSKDKNAFIYGEILNTPGPCGIDAYTKYINVTNTQFDWAVFNAVGSNAGSVVSRNTQNFGDDPSKWVTWVESHDTFEGTAGDSSGKSVEQMNIGWCMQACRSESVPLYFVRPGGSFGYSESGWKDKRVAAVNRFHNHFAGIEESAKSINGDKVLMVERGDSGVCFVNVNGNECNIETETNLSNGTYKDQVSGSTFTVSNGKITGSISSGGVAVVYDPDDKPGSAAKISASEADCSFLDSIKVTLNVSNAEKATYKIDDGKEQSFKDGETIEIGKDAKPGDVIKLTLCATNSSGSEKSVSYSYTKKDPDDARRVYLKLPSDWEKAYVYLYDDGSSLNNGSWPGVEMKKVEGKGNLYYYDVPDDYVTPLAIVNNGDDNNLIQCPASKEPGYKVTTSVICDGTTWEKYDSKKFDSTEEDKDDNTSKDDEDKKDDTDVKEDDQKDDTSKDNDKKDDTTIKDDDNKNDSDKKDEEATVYEKLALEEIKFSEESPQYTNTNIKVSAINVTGGDKNYTYIFSSNGKIIASGEKSYAYWNPTEAGEYTIKVKVVDGQGSSISKTYKYIIEDKKDDEEEVKPLAINSFELLSGDINAKVDDTLSFKCSSENGNGNVKYALFVLKEGETKPTCVVKYSKNSTLDWTPEEEGTYSVYAKAQDEDNTLVESNKISITVSKKDNISDKTEETGDTNGAIIALIGLISSCGLLIRKRK